ncbi:hypothetical protein [Mesorhizobium sp. A556]
MNTPREPLDYRDLESELEDALSMAAIASEQVEKAFVPLADMDRTTYRLTDGEVRLVHFAVYHSENLLRAVKARWDEIHESNIVDKEGGAK